MSQRYTDEQREDALRQLVVIGNSEMIAERTGIPARTIRDWRNMHAQRFYELSKLHAKASDDSATAKLRELTHESIDTSLRLVRELNRDIDEGRVKDSASALHKTLFAIGIPIDKTAMLEGRPTSIVEHRDSAAILRRWGGELIIDGEAEEITSEPTATPGELSADSRLLNAPE